MGSNPKRVILILQRLRQESVKLLWAIERDRVSKTKEEKK